MEAVRQYNAPPSRVIEPQKAKSNERISIQDNRNDSPGFYSIKDLFFSEKGKFNPLKQTPSTSLVVQRCLDDLGELNEDYFDFSTLLDSMGYDEGLILTASLDHLKELHETLVSTQKSDHNEDMMRNAFSAFSTFLDNNYMENNYKAWKDAVTLAERGRLNNNAFDISTCWLCPAPMSPLFSKAVEERVKEQVDALVDDLYGSYLSSNKLLQGAINKVKAAAAQQNLSYTGIANLLQSTYDIQCTPSIEKWWNFLSTGKRMLGTLNNHMTIFKNALATAPINVITNSLETIMEHLFNSVTLAMQIHVTIIVSNIKYHMYYDGNILEEGKNTFKEQRREDEEQRKEDEEQGRTDREQDRTDRELNRKNIEHKLEPIYKDMILYLTGKVQKVIDNHGRIDLI